MAEAQCERPIERVTEGGSGAATIRRLPGPTAVRLGFRAPEQRVGQHGPSVQGHPAQDRAHKPAMKEGQSPRSRPEGAWPRRSRRRRGRPRRRRRRPQTKKPVAKKPRRVAKKVAPKPATNITASRRPTPTKQVAKKPASNKPARRRRPRQKVSREEGGDRRRRPRRRSRRSRKAPAAPTKAPMKVASNPTPAPAAKAAPKPPPVKKEPPPKKLPPPLAASTLDKLRELLDEARASHAASGRGARSVGRALASEREQGDTQFDEESGEGDTISVERERDLSLSATARQTVDDIDRALRAHPHRHVRRVRDLSRPHPGRPARGHPVGRAVREVQGPWRTASLRRERLTPSRSRHRMGRSRRCSRIVAIDQLTKVWAVAALADGPQHVIG